LKNKIKGTDKFSLRFVAVRFVPFSLVIFIIALSAGLAYRPIRAQGECTAEFLPVSTPLNDLGADEYIRMDGASTGFLGGLYPGGFNVRPPDHEDAGVIIASQIVPLDELGHSDPADGKIVLISVGMSNTRMEFEGFIDQVVGDSTINPKLVIVNGGQGAQVSDRWADPNAEAWDRLEQFLKDAGVTPLQVQVAWVKLAQFGSGDFPAKAQSLQIDLEAVSRNLKSRFPNIRIAYNSSRTRAYLYWDGLSPEPTAFETGFAVKWMVEDQINGDPDLNFDPSSGEVVAPYLSWGPYLWIDGLNPRSDGLIWTQNDVQEDCIHPSESGVQKVANQLMSFFKTDTTSKSWFLADPTAPTPTPTPPAPPRNKRVFIPLVQLELRSSR
jgi:hypothetical protein